LDLRAQSRTTDRTTPVPEQINNNDLTETGPYSITPSSNRITGISGALARTYASDAAGNTTGYSTVTASYNNAGRLKTLTNGSSTETSVYNALGQRIRISGLDLLCVDVRAIFPGSGKVIFPRH
jgi:YD repeat-containing protein